jgi:hypothetical protein
VVPYKEGVVESEELLHVAAALQTQATRDLAPVWGLSAVIQPFLRLEDVPPGYIALAIVEELPPPWHGFHVVEDSQPLALIGYGRGWSLLASHELVELLCDPWGNRRLPGASLKKGQGEVEYLVEVCDPCQQETYLINDVVVADFVTPDYYGPLDSTGSRYSFTGSIDRALQVAAGGYISWRTPSGQIWQKAGGAEPRKLKHVTFSRVFIDAHPGSKRPDVADKLPKSRSAPGPHYGLGKPARAHGEDLKTIIARILEQLGVKAPKARLEDIVKLVRELAKPGSQTRTDWEKDPVKTLKKFGLDPPAGVKKLTPLPPPEHYQGVVAALDGGLGVGDPKLAQWLSTHGVLFPAGIW